MTVSAPSIKRGLAERSEVWGSLKNFSPLIAFGDLSPLYEEGAFRCGGNGPMSTRKGQAASVTLLRREQLRSASAPTSAAAILQDEILF